HEREETEQRTADVLEDARPAGEDLLQERLEQARDADDQDDRARIAPELRQHAERGRGGSASAHPRASIKRRKTASSASAPVCSRSSAGVPAASSRPSRMSRSRWQRSASSITWLETRSVVPAAARRWKVSQRSRRRTGSRPTVGSSSTSSSGAPRSAVASEARAGGPPDSRPPTRAARRPRPTAASASSTRARGAPSRRAK